MASSECKLPFENKYFDSNILLEIDKRGVATIILNRPDKHNCLDNHMVAGLSEALDDLDNFLSEKSNCIRILVVRARGKSFCAGADLKHMQAMINFSYQENYDDAMMLAKVLERLNNFPAPSLSIVNGAAYGGGVGLICCTDFAYAVNDAQFCLSEVKLGLIPAVISPYIVNTCGLKIAKQIIITAEKLTAHSAQNYGILSAVADNLQDLELMTDKLISDLLNNGPMAMQEAKQLLASYNHLQNNIYNTVEAIAKIRVGQEGQEGLTAFLQKRKPKWINE